MDKEDGIVIYLYFYDNERHKTPHVHAKHQGQDASISKQLWGQALKVSTWQSNCGARL
ncbi:MAG TPA: hypothetical protein DDY22_09550 [Geobacter sp.]|nr:hypothetical protein [Geobacter sp.]